MQLSYCSQLHCVATQFCQRFVSWHFTLLGANTFNVWSTVFHLFQICYSECIQSFYHIIVRNVLVINVNNFKHSNNYVKKCNLFTFTSFQNYKGVFFRNGTIGISSLHSTGWANLNLSWMDCYHKIGERLQSLFRQKSHTTPCIFCACALHLNIYSILTNLIKYLWSCIQKWLQTGSLDL